MNPAKFSLDIGSRYFLATAVVLTVLQAGLFYYFYPKLPPQVPLLYSLPWGEGRLVAPIWLAVLPGISAGLLTVNFFGSALLHEVVLTRILSSTAFLVALLTLLTLTKIIFLGLP